MLNLAELNASEMRDIGGGMVPKEPCHCFCVGYGLIERVSSPEQCRESCQNSGYEPDRCVTLNDEHTRSKVVHYFVGHMVS